MLAELLRLHPREAAARQVHRVQLAQRRSLVGELLPPRLPATARALREGAIGVGHVEVIDKALQQLPDSFDLQTRTGVEEQVAGFARDYSPRETGILAAQLIERLDPDGAGPPRARRGDRAAQPAVCGPGPGWAAAAARRVRHRR